MTKQDQVEANAPDWDMTPYFSSADGQDFRAFRDRLVADISELSARVAALGAVGESTRQGWVSMLCALEDASARLGHLGSYLGCMTAADAGDEAATREQARLSVLGAELGKIVVAVALALRDAPEAEAEALFASGELAGAGYFLSRLRARARWSMPAELEALAADLGVTGLDAWGRLYDRVSGTLTFALERPDGSRERLPVAMARTLCEDGDAAVRRAAMRGAAAAWESVAETVAACLNGISGARLTLYARRGVEHFLDPALFDAAIERATLDAMMEAVRARQEIARRYLRAKARLLGRERLGFQDLEAPLPGAGGERISWEAAKQRVLEAFGRFYPALRDLAERAFRERWIDHTPRPGRRPGGFCSSSRIIDQSRVFMTFNGAMGDAQTLAHELGHAFHSRVMVDMRPWQRRYPMTLAETASTFAERLVTDATLQAADPGSPARLAILDHRLADGAAFMLNIPTRYDFERRLYAERADGELSVARLCELMVEAQRENYGDALDPDELDPWFWASKLHFYITGVSFYNYPYTFGHLFSTAIFARAMVEGPAFLPTYERLLRRTGSDTAEGVAREVLGADLGDPAFWHGAIDLVERDLDAFEAEIAKRPPADCAAAGRLTIWSKTS